MIGKTVSAVAAGGILAALAWAAPAQAYATLGDVERLESAVNAQLTTVRKEIQEIDSLRRIDAVKAQITNLLAGIAIAYAGADENAEVDMGALRAKHLVPIGMLDGERLVHPWKGEVKVGGTVRSPVIILLGLPKQACELLVREQSASKVLVNGKPREQQGAPCSQGDAVTFVF